ncbi:MAG: lytic transglycosylase domain-containing protein [Pseudomonadota bacterium]
MQVKALFSMIVMLMVLVFSPAQASTNKALQALDKKDWNTAYRYGASIQNSLEKKAFNWFAYIQGDPNASFSQIYNFMAENSDWPAQTRLRVLAEQRMPSSFVGTQALQFFEKNDPITSQRMDIYVRSLQSKGQKQKAKLALNEWWPEANLSRQQQKDIFARYKDILEVRAHIKRFNHLIFDNKYDHASGIAMVLGEGYQALLKARKAIRQKSGNENALINAVPKNLQSNEGLLYDRLKWRREKKLNQGAIEILNQSPTASQMVDSSLWWRERHIIIRRLIDKKKYIKAYMLASTHKQKEGFPKSQAEWVSGWLALRFINKPWQAFEHFEALYNHVETPISKARGAYWAGRASEKMQYPDIARKWYDVASQYPFTFYGQLAVQKTGMPVKISKVNSKVIPSAQYQKSELAKVAKIFHRAKLSKEAQQFLTRLYLNAKTSEQYIAAAKQANELGYDQISIRAAAQLQKDLGVNAIEYLYPVARAQNTNNLELSAVNAIIRQESRFDKNAVSRAGARGLMQLMPATAKETARKLYIPHQKSWLTQRPKHNIQLGSYYLADMLRRYDGNYAMAAAAYNAGPGRVDNWIKEFGDPRTNQIDFLDWAELISIYETRNYVQRVLEAVIVYRELLDQKSVSGKTHLD